MKKVLSLSMFTKKAVNVQKQITVLFNFNHADNTDTNFAVCQTNLTCKMFSNIRNHLVYCTVAMN